MNLFRAAQGHGPDWRTARRSCLEQLRGLPAGANLGFVYASDPLAESLDLIARDLAEATGIQDWVGTGGAGVCASGQEHFHQGAVVVLVAALPAASYRVLDGLRADPDEAGPAAGAWSGIEEVGFGVVHGDPRQPRTPDAIARLSEQSGAFLVGGLSSSGGSAIQIAGRPTEGGISGVLLDASVEVVTGLSQGCTPIGPVHEVSAAQGPWVVGLDGRPALDVLKEEIGEVLARQLDRLGSYIHAAIPILGSDRADYMVRNLLGVHPERGMVAVGEELRRGAPLMFVKRDAASARADLERLLEDLTDRAAGRPIRGALYHTCVARGPHMFGPDSAELRTIERALGPVPLAGFFTNGEIFHDRLYGYTGVLTLFL
jgi:small ligand-binding sensory domain FIST